VCCDWRSGGHRLEAQGWRLDQPDCPGSRHLAQHGQGDLTKRRSPDYHRRDVLSKLDPCKGYLLDRLREFPELSAHRLFDEVRAQGYAGQISILKDFTRQHRIPRK